MNIMVICITLYYLVQLYLCAISISRMPGGRKELISIRIDPDLREKLRSESIQKKSNLNSLINQILTLHVNWDEFGTQMGRLSMSRKTFRTLLDALDEKTVVRIAETVAKEEYKTAAMFYFGKADLHCVIQFMENWLTSANLKFRHTADDDKNVYIIEHDLGKNWSLLFLTRLGSILSEFGYKIIGKDPDERCFTFEISKMC